MVRKIEVLIVDDEEFFREALVEIVKSFEDLTVVGDMSSGATALQFLENNACDVVLCDVRMPHMNGIEFTELSRHLDDPPQVVAVTSFNNDVSMVSMLRAGANGFILKSARRQDIADGIRSAVQGGTSISPDAARYLKKFLRPPVSLESDVVSALDRRVLTELHYGLSNAYISRELGISVPSVKKSVNRLMQVFGASSRLQLVVLTSP